MGFALVDYNAPAAGVNTVNLDFSAVSDPDFTQRNGHFTLTEPYRMLGAMAVGASVIRGRFQIPTWNALGEWQLFNVNRGLQPTSNPQWDWYGAFGPPIPMNEEVQVQLSNNLGAATEIENCGLLLATQDWTPAMPAGLAKFIVRASFTVTPTLNAWSGPQTIALSANLRNGVYAVVGATLQGTNAAFFRIVFPKYRLYMGRKLRPGGPVQTNIGDVLSNQLPIYQMSLGEWGRFHTFELPGIEVLGTAAVSTTYQAFLWLVYLGADQSLLNQGLGGGPILSAANVGPGWGMGFAQ
jgi:hypothetical protein